MERKPTSSTEAVARGSGSSMEGVRLTGKVMELQIGMAAATMMQVQVVLKALGKMEAHLGPTSRLYLSFMRKVGKRIDAMEEDTFMVAAAVLDPYTHYSLNLCNHTDYATALTDAIAKILDPKGALSAIDEVSKFRECQGRFGTRLAQEAAARMEPTQWWFQFGGDVPALQKSANESLLTMCLI
ncbi:uncharacterized protein [Triticum aestivum]|uniref:uncharacterized protein isoform X2 n=1 Tax=Triticum aestivum TaxID=4565 RepID=UPI001D0100A5|nr:uncharacterized protein LOC123084840 isoform X2 [Triticum aestivum]